MGSEESGVSGPLKHLLSIDWENAVEIPHENNSDEVHKNHKQCKKVRFAEELEHIKFIDINDRQECDDGQLVCKEDYEISIETLKENDSSNSLQSENEDERTLSQIDYEEKRGPENESSTICTNLALTSTYVDNIDADIENWREPEENKQTQLFKMAPKKSIVGKQSSKINSLLEKKTFSCARAAEFQKAIFQVWCEVKNEQRMEKTEKNNPLTNKNVEKEEKTNIHFAYMMWKKSKQVQRRKNMQRKSNPGSCSDAPNLKDKEESEAVFKMWKKKKDAILMRRKSEESRLEQEQTVNTLMNAELRKEEAELAFVAWKYHKDEHLKKEKHKQDWMQLREKEKDFIQHKKYEEASNAYSKWLEKKNTYAEHNEIFAEDSKQKVPWYPPSKT